MYISENNVREIIADVMRPLVSKSKEDSLFMKKLNERLNHTDNVLQDTKKEVQSLNKLSGLMDDMNKQIARQNMELNSFKNYSEGVNKKHITTQERLFFLQEKLKQQMELDS